MVVQFYIIIAHKQSAYDIFINFHIGIWGEKEAVVFAHVEFPSHGRPGRLVKCSEVQFEWILSEFFPSSAVGHKVKGTHSL